MARSLSATVIPLLVLAACAGKEGGFSVYNSNPTPVITWPSDGEVIEGTDPVTLTGRGEDSESDNEQLLSEWQIDGTPICEDVALASDGTTTCTAGLPTGSHTITLVLTDPDGGVSQESVSVVVEASNSPVVQLLTPDGSVNYYQGTDIAFTGAVADSETSPSDLDVRWESSIDGDLDVDDSPDGAGDLAGSSRLTAGLHIVTLFAVDADGYEGSDSVEITVREPNQAPDCDIVTPENGAASDSGVSVDFSGTADDPDVDPELLTAVWSSDLDGELHSEMVTPDGITDFDVDTLIVGTHVITLTVTDDAGLSCTDSILFNIGTPPSVVIDNPADGDVVNEGDLITFEGTIADSETAPHDLAVRWTSDLDGELDTSTAPDLGGVEGDSGEVGFGVSDLTIGTHVISLRATDGDAMYTVDTIALRINDLPSAATISLDPDPAYTSNNVTVSIDANATDAEGDAISYAYEWWKNGTLTAITTATFPSTDTVRGDAIEARVTAFDGYGAGDVATASLTISNSPPVTTAPALTPDPAYEGDTMVCAVGTSSDDDGDTVVDAYSWYVNGVVVSASTSTLGSTFFAAGDNVYCGVTPFDGTSYGTIASSNVITISNTAPVVSTAAITPDPAKAADTLTCGYTYADVDGDSDASTVTWTINGTSAGTGSTLTGGFVFGDTVACSVEAYDGADTGNTITDSITISNTAPVLSSVSLTPTTATTTDDMTCTPGSSTDADGGAVSYSYAWQVNGSTVSETSSTLDSGDHERGDNVACLVTPNDGTDNGSAVTSNTVTISNTAPVISAVALSPTTIGTEDVVTASATSSDVDGDAVTYTYDWYVSSALVQSGASSSLDGLTYFDRGDTVYVVVTPTDGTTAGSAFTSSTITVGNTVPEAPVVSISPTSPGINIDDLVCGVATASYDADGDAITYTATWLADSVAYTTGLSTTTWPNDTVPATYTHLATTWQCVLTPNDGTANGSAGAATTTVSDQTAPGAPTIDTPLTYVNSDALDQSGTCTYGDHVDITVECNNSVDGTFSSSTTCLTDGTWDLTISGVARGVPTNCVAYGTDAAGNESGDSSTVSTTVCDPEDAYEDGTGYGDSVTDPVDEWAILADDGLTTINVTANILEDGSDTEDWYVIETDDNSSTDTTAGIDYYNLDIRLYDEATGAASTLYKMVVYRGSSTGLECATTGYDAYNDYKYDAADGVHSQPADARSCGNSTSRNVCEDNSNTYYVKVTRQSSAVTSCGGYELEITNGAWTCNSTDCPY